MEGAFNLVEKDQNPTKPPNTKEANWLLNTKTFNRLIQLMSETYVEIIANVEVTGNSITEP